MTRTVLKRKTIYNAEQSVDFISTGCCVLNLVLGGGYPVGRCINIVGDKSTGKTLLAIEAMVNFQRHFKNNCLVVYNETEAAFDSDYAASLGMPMDMVEMVSDCSTVEDLHDHIKATIDKSKEKDLPVLYVVDSLDALSDEAEMDRGIRDGTYGMGKQKKMSELFRRLVRQMNGSKMLFIVISQIRTKIGNTFGTKIARSGGRALDFYASQVIYLHHIGRITKTIEKVKREVGVDVRAKCEKNKVGKPLRQCQFPILFGYGVDDVYANLLWLKDNNLLDRAGYSDPSKEIKKYRLLDDKERRKYHKDLEDNLRAQWQYLEEKFDPPGRKYR